MEKANPQEVRQFFLWQLKLEPPITFKDLGAIDDEFIRQLHLSNDGYPEELRKIVRYLDDSNLEQSIEDLVRAKEKMKAADVAKYREALVEYMKEIHGIAVVYDRSDVNHVREMEATIEDLAAPVFREYSMFLRTKKAKTDERTPFDDVRAQIDESRSQMQQIIKLALDNANAERHEQERILDSRQVKRTRRIIEEVFKRVRIDQPVSSDIEEVMNGTPEPADLPQDE
jgi:hypothetical protein